MTSSLRGTTMRSLEAQIPSRLHILTVPTHSSSDFDSSPATTARGPLQRTSHNIDVHLLSLASAGDDSAFTSLVTRFHPLVFRWALTFARDADEAEDIAQE